MARDARIKKFEPADEDAVLSFLRAAYPAEPLKSDRGFWRWHFLENPNTSLDDVPLWLVVNEEGVIGQMASIPVEVKVGASRKRALWIVDYILLPECRGTGLGKRLLDIPLEYCPTLLTLGYNEHSAKVMWRIGWVSLGQIKRFQRLLFPGDAAKEISRRGALRSFANLAYAPLRPSAAALRPSARGEVREVVSFDSSFDNLWTRASAQWTCAVVRDSRMLEWQFRKQPGKKFDVLGYYEEGRLLGYAILYFRKPEGAGRVSPKVAITDLLYDPMDAERIIDELLKGALRLAIERRAGAIVTDVRDARVEEGLRRHGFWPVKSAPPFAALTSEDHETVFNAGNWFLTRGDCDVSIFEEPNL